MQLGSLMAERCPLTSLRLLYILWGGVRRECVPLEQAQFFATDDKVYRQDGCSNEGGGRCQNHAHSL